MTKKKRLGSDPLAQPWIRDTRTGTKERTVQEAEKSTRKGLPPGWTRATVIVREDLLEKVKDLAYWDRVQIKEIVDEALQAYLKGKRIKQRPKGRR